MCKGNFVKIGHVVLGYESGQTDRHTDTHGLQYFTNPLGVK